MNYLLLAFIIIIALILDSAITSLTRATNSAGRFITHIIIVGAVIVIFLFITGRLG